MCRNLRKPAVCWASPPAPIARSQNPVRIACQVAVADRGLYRRACACGCRGVVVAAEAPLAKAKTKQSLSRVATTSSRRCKPCCCVARRMLMTDPGFPQPTAQHGETMRTNTSYNLATASQATGRNKGTILKAIKSGRISAGRDENGGWCIEPIELHRVYPPTGQINAATASETAPPTSRHTELPNLSWRGNLSNWGNWDANHGNPTQPQPTVAEITELRARLADARDEIEFLRRSHTDLTAERAKLLLMITDQRQPAKPWWRRSWR